MFKGQIQRHSEHSLKESFQIYGWIYRRFFGRRMRVLSGCKREREREREGERERERFY